MQKQQSADADYRCIFSLNCEVVSSLTSQVDWLNTATEGQFSPVKDIFRKTCLRHVLYYEVNPLFVSRKSFKISSTVNSVCVENVVKHQPTNHNIAAVDTYTRGFYGHVWLDKLVLKCFLSRYVL